MAFALLDVAGRGDPAVEECLMLALAVVILIAGAFAAEVTIIVSSATIVFFLRVFTSEDLVVMLSSKTDVASVEVDEIRESSIPDEDGELSPESKLAGFSTLLRIALAFREETPSGI